MEFDCAFPFEVSLPPGAHVMQHGQTQRENLVVTFAWHATKD